MKTPNVETAVPALCRTLCGKDYFTLALGSVVGVGWMLPVDDWLARGGSGDMAGERPTGF